MLNVRSVADLNLALVRAIPRIDRTKFDAIVGIPRSGMIPASLLSTHLQLPLSDVETFCREGMAFRRYHTKVPARRILLVDDSVNKGRAMNTAFEQVKQHAKRVTRFAVFGPYQLEDPKTVCDFFCEECRGPRVFQWNMWKHIRLWRWGFDFDGVFCRDPSNQENDDGPAYLNFIRNAEPLFLPQRPIGHIITSRLEKYREETDAWLVRHGIKYEKMHMMPYATKAERMAAGGRGQWKAKVFKETDCEFFIESSPKQAHIMSKEGIQVWCTSTQTIVSP